LINFTFTDKDTAELRHLRFTHPHTHVQKKMDVLLLKAYKIPHHLIASITGNCENTIRSYFSEYEEGGVERLQQLNFHTPESELISKKDEIKAHFEKEPPATLKQASAAIEKLTGIKRSLSQIRLFLLNNGMARRKVGSIPAKADTEKQKNFIDEEMEPRLQEAKENKRAVYFIDAAHFVLAPFLGFLWCFTRLFIKAAPGRQRFNVLGALNAITHNLITVTNESYINAQSVCELLLKISEQHLKIPVTLILDNARYQKCKIVAELAKQLDIELLYLPSYSPNLNIIERLWKFVKKKCLNNIYHENFFAFRTAIADLVNNLHQHKKELDTLLTLNFQTFLENSNKSNGLISTLNKPCQLPVLLPESRTSRQNEKRRARIFRHCRYKMPSSIPCSQKNNAICING
jgi:transposase